MQRLGDLFPEAALQIRIIDAVVGQLVAQVVERLGNAGNLVGRLEHVLQRSGDAEPPPRERSLG